MEIVLGKEVVDQDIENPVLTTVVLQELEVLIKEELLCGSQITSVRVESLRSKVLPDMAGMNAGTADIAVSLCNYSQRKKTPHHCPVDISVVLFECVFLDIPP